MKPNHRFLNACRCQPVDATPVWLMRQAGRYMPEYRALRQQHTLLELIKTPELAAAVTAQPLDAFDLDAAIIFADILTLPEAMGLELEFVHGEGPVFHNPIRHTDDLKRLRRIDPAVELHWTLSAIRLVTQSLAGRLPLIGFSGAPFTLACYAIEGGSSRHFILAKSFMYQQPKAWHTLMQRLADTVATYLIAQVEAGATALQLFDSWAGILGPEDYVEYALPHTRAVIEQVKAATDVPLIHFGTETATLLPAILQTGADVIGIDWRLPVVEARALIGPDRALQGNLDPVTLFADVPTIERQTRRILDATGGQPGHIFNLGHGVLPETPMEHVAALIDIVHRYPVAEAP